MCSACVPHARRGSGFWSSFCVLTVALLGFAARCIASTTMCICCMLIHYSLQNDDRLFTCRGIVAEGRGMGISPYRWT